MTIVMFVLIIAFLVLSLNVLSLNKMVKEYRKLLDVTNEIVEKTQKDVAGCGSYILRESNKMKEDNIKVWKALNILDKSKVNK